EGADRDLIDQLEAMVERGMAAMSASASPIAAAGEAAAPTEAPAMASPPTQPAAPAEPKVTQGHLVEQTLERPLRPGEVSLDELERAFRETATEVAPAAPAAPAPKAAAAPAAEAEAPKKAAKRPIAAETDMAEGDKVANQSIRVNVDTLEHLMT